MTKLNAGTAREMMDTTIALISGLQRKLPRSDSEFVGAAQHKLIRSLDGSTMDDPFPDGCARKIRVATTEAEVYFKVMRDRFPAPSGATKGEEPTAEHRLVSEILSNLNDIHGYIVGPRDE